MTKKSEITYPVDEEIVGAASLKLDGEQTINTYSYTRIADIIYNFTGIDKDKLLYFIVNFGLAKMLEDPSILGLDEEKEDSLKNLKQLLGD